MSDSNRGERSEALGPKLGVTLAIALSCLIVGFFSYRSGHNTGTEQTSATEYEQSAKRNAQIACGGLPAGAIADCVYDEISSARQHEQAEQDLDAQQWMAWWAAWLTVISAATTVISWVALRYLKDTFSKTAEMAGEARDATRAMVKANEIAANAQRPWITIEAGKPTFVQHGKKTVLVSIPVTFTNIGKTVAKHFQLRTHIYSAPADYESGARSFYD